MPRIALWLNRNYATTVHLIDQLRNNPAGRELTIYGSHKDLSSPVLAACDYRFAEPALTGREYSDHALRFCEEHDVTVFLPVYEQHAVASRADEFQASGVALIAPSAASIAILSDKAATYRAVGDDLDLVPPWREIGTADEFEAAVRDLSLGDRKLVVKPTRGVGATGVRILTDTVPSLAHLTGPVTHAAGIQDFVGALKTAEAIGEEIPRLLVMPYLDEPEISVDVLASSGRTVAAVPRSKNGRDRSLDAPDGVLRAASHLVEKFALDGLVNVQFRMLDGHPVLLEINTRPSGGLY